MDIRRKRVYTDVVKISHHISCNFMHFIFTHLLSYRLFCFKLYWRKRHEGKREKDQRRQPGVDFIKVNHGDSFIHLHPAPTPNFWEAILWHKSGAKSSKGRKPVYEINPSRKRQTWWTEEERYLMDRRRKNKVDGQKDSEIETK